MAGTRREYLGWIYLAALFLLVVANSLAAQKSNDKAGRFTEAEQLLRQVVQEKAIKNPLLADTASKTTKELQKALAPYRTKDPRAAEIDAACNTLLGAPVDRSEIQPMAASKDPVDREAAVLFSSPKVSVADSQRMADRFRTRGFLGELMAAEAFNKAGDPRPLQRLTQSTAVKLTVLLTILGVIFVGSLAVWAYVASEKAAGRLRPLGFRVAVPTLLDADRLALRAASLLFLFLVLSAAPALVSLNTHQKFSEPASTLMVGVSMLLGVPLLFQTPVLGRVVSLRELGVDGHSLLKNVGIGLAGFLLELPLAMILAALGAMVFSGMHPNHPVTTELMTNHDPLMVASLFFFASVVAPFWEEIMFRGLLFPAFSRLTGRVLYGAIVSSFLFGAVHPQGLPLWLALMAVAGMSCALSYHTRSMVPSIVMHAAHNSTLLVLTLLYS